MKNHNILQAFQASTTNLPLQAFQASATNLPYPDNYFYAVFTDPPYYVRICKGLKEVLGMEICKNEPTST
ncbi:MAG: hypothetical protein QMD80_01180 [archaeon]|nr:hypothetical protein [archaeon]